MANYGQPYMLEDQSGALSGSVFIDIHGRMRLAFKCTMNDPSRHVFMIYANGPPAYDPSQPLAVLDFGPDFRLGSVKIKPNKDHIPMKDYLVKLSMFANPRVRRFVASDGQPYTWAYRSTQHQEWTCTNASGYFVASYELKVPGEPPYSSSGCMLLVEEGYPHLAVELLASLMIMRYIVHYNLS